ncbi:MAG: helix-turn-helix transcriptional regulator [Clostridia bacterium]|nr:helix-turn-helix transcriptional regulator [Clostridia bacterium]
MKNKSIFAKNLKLQMALNNKSRRDVCGDLGFNYYTFTDWVNGKKYPRMDKVEALANYFGIQKSDLIEEKPTDANDGLPENVVKLIEFAKCVPEDKADIVLRVMKSIVEDGK